MANCMEIKSVNVLSVGISVLNLPSAVDAIAGAVRSRRKGYICVRDAHGVISWHNGMPRSGAF